MKCEHGLDFECKSGKTKCVPRSSVNNKIQECSDGSDENVENFTCFEYEFSCKTKNDRFNDSEGG